MFFRIFLRFTEDLTTTTFFSNSDWFAVKYFVLLQEESSAAEIRIKRMYLACKPLSCMISKSFEKYVNSLKQKKYREERQRFIAEGEKVCTEFLKEGWNVERIIATT